jgi:DNA repair exonuclease SbcCD ATPase subunit
MNAPENITPINLAHEVLMGAKDAMCVEEVTREIVGKKPTKAELKPVAKLLKELADLGMIEMKPRTGGVPFYRLIAAPPSVVTHNPHTGTPRNPLDIKSDPAGLLIVKDGEPLKAHQAEDRILTPEAEAEREDFEARYGMLGNCSCHISPPCGSCTHPGNPRNQEEDETAWMAAPAGSGLNFGTSPLQFLAPEDYEMPPADPTLLAMANRTLSEQLDEYRGQLAHIATIAADYLPDPSDITTARAVEIMDMLIEAQKAQIESLSAGLQAKDNELFIQAKVVVDLRERLDAQITQWQTDTGRLAADLRAAMEARSQAINEADRLRAELATERQAREALQEQDGVDVKDAAVGYLVRVTKRKPRYVTRPERARDAALAAVRAGAGRAEVLAVVPVGVARRGAEWRGSNPMGKGD